MSGYLRSIPVEIDFDGDKVRARIKPITFDDLMLFRGRFKKEDLTKEEKGQEAIALFREVLPKYIESIEGLKDAAGADISKEEVVTQSYFAPVVAQLGNALMGTAHAPDPKVPAEPSAS